MKVYSLMKRPPFPSTDPNLKMGPERGGGGGSHFSDQTWPKYHFPAILAQIPVPFPVFVCNSHIPTDPNPIFPVIKWANPCSHFTASHLTPLKKHICGFRQHVAIPTTKTIT